MRRIGTVIKLNFALNNAQFAAFLAAMHARYPEFRHQTADLPISRAQIMKNDTCVAIKPLGKFTLPFDTEETATRILQKVLANTTLAQDTEINWSQIMQAHRKQEALAA
jgi:hypothetical protein